MNDFPALTAALDNLIGIEAKKNLEHTFRQCDEQVMAAKKIIEQLERMREQGVSLQNPKTTLIMSTLLEAHVGLAQYYAQRAQIVVDASAAWANRTR